MSDPIDDAKVPIAKVEVTTSTTVDVGDCHLELRILLADGFKLTASCPNCSAAIYRHRNLVVVPSVLTGDEPSSVESVTAGKGTSKSIPFKGIKFSVWHKSLSCTVFLDAHERKLRNMAVEPSLWAKSLAFVVESDEPAAIWVDTHIVLPNLTWKHARSVFLDHFQSADFMLTLQREWEAIRQSSGETVQSFGHRFSSLVQRLGYTKADMRPLIVQHFISRLQPSLHREFIRWQASIGCMVSLDEKSEKGDDDADEPPVKYSTLVAELTFEQVWRTCIKLSLAQVSVPDAGSIHTQSSSAKKSGSRLTVKSCANHPASTTHNTAECKAGKASGSSSKPSVSSSSSRHNTPSKVKSSGGGEHPDIQCFQCKAWGHYANVCPHPKSPSSSSSSSSSSSNTQRSPNTNTTTTNTKPSSIKSETQSTIRHSSRNDGKPSPHYRAMHIQGEEEPKDDGAGEETEESDEEEMGFTTNHSVSSSFNDQYNRHLTVVDDVKCSQVDPTPVLKAVNQRILTGLTLVMGSHLLNALVDSGADSSVLDIPVVSDMKLAVKLVPGVIKLAVNNMTAPRNGVTEPVAFTALFPLSIDDRELTPVTLSWSFEVATLGSSTYQCIIGKDLIPKLFGASVPLAYIIGEVPGPSSVSSSVPEVTINTLVPVLQMDAITSAGIMGTSQDIPVRAVLNTDPSLEHGYSVKRASIMRQLEPLLEINRNIVGFCNLPECVVHLVVDPVKSAGNGLYRKQYKVAESSKPAVSACVDRWFVEERIELAPPGCPFNNPLLVVPKKDDQGQLTGVRICLDVRALNAAITVQDRFQLPYIRDVLESFVGSTIFGELDLAEAYLQFPLAEDSKQYTAFTWNQTQYVFRGAPFGISQLPSHFQRMMNRMFSGLSFVIPFLDNLPFGSSSWEEHATHVIALVSRCNQYNLRIKDAAIKVGNSHMACLGHVLSGAGVGIDPKKLQVIMDWPRPVTGAQLQSFLGLITFIRQYVRHIGELTGPLEAVKYNKVIEWSSTMDECFVVLKKAIASAPVLRFPDFNQPFYLATDASQSGIGGVLYQPTAGTGEDIAADNMVALCSKKLNASQVNYSVYKKELYALIYSLRQFHCYLWGRTDTVIYTDHKPLIYMFESAQLSVPLQQWLDVILDYSFTIRYRAGVQNVVPDCLSRMFSAMYDRAVWGTGVPAKGVLVDDDGNVLWNGAGGSNQGTGVSSTGVGTTHSSQPSQPPPALHSNVNVLHMHLRAGRGRDDQKYSNDRTNTSDPLTMQHLPSIEQLNPIEQHSPSIEQLNPIEPTTTPTQLTYPTATTTQLTSSTPRVRSSGTSTDAALSIYPSFHDVRSSDPSNALLVLMEQRGKRIPPVEEREPLIVNEHSLGHYGRDAIYQSLYQKNIWWPNLRAEIQTVIEECDQCARYNVMKNGFHPARFILANGPWDHIQVDTSVHLPVSADGYECLLVMIDVFSGFIILRALKSNTAELVAYELWQLVSTFGLPKIVQSDNGSEFNNAVIRALVKLMGNEHRFITPWNPRCDGKVERSIGSVMTIIKKLLHGTARFWPLFTSFAQLAFNTKVNTLTGSTPFSLMFARAANPIMNYDTNPTTDSMIDIKTWRDYQQRVISLVYPSIHKRSLLSKHNMVKSINSHRKQLLLRSIPNGTTVMLLDQMKNDKWEPAAVGPYTVIRRLRNGSYALRDAVGDLLDRHVPADKLRVLKRRRVKSDIFAVESILEHRGVAPDYEYLVKWVGYCEATWEPQANFNDDKVIREYWVRTQQPTTTSVPNTKRNATKRTLNSS